jgi:hypothetical protein
MIYRIVLAGLCLPSFLLSMEGEVKGEEVAVVREFPYKVAEDVLFHLNEAIRLHEKTEESYSMPSDAYVLAAYLIAHRKRELRSCKSVEKGLVYAVEEGEFRLATEELEKFHFDKAVELLKKDSSADATALLAQLEAYEWPSLLHSRLNRSVLPAYFT